ncbi:MULTISPECIES: winged helix DNA-binding protein [Halorussus]|uniref:Winged helix DNA-binding protein n=1 Tax=Halorussus aquaticus TaxID=2953748 RepID=A0ABD5QAU3_9EURY
MNVLIKISGKRGDGLNDGLGEYHGRSRREELHRELEALGQTNTEDGQFSPCLNELVERGLVTKTDHPDDARGFTCDLTDEGKTVLTQLFVGNAISLDIDFPESYLPAEPPRPGRRGVRITGWSDPNTTREGRISSLN